MAASFVLINCTVRITFLYGTHENAAAFLILAEKSTCKTFIFILRRLVKGEGFTFPKLSAVVIEIIMYSRRNIVRHVIFLRKNADFSYFTKH